MNYEKLSSLVSHGALKSEHLDKIISYLNQWHPDHDLSREVHAKTSAYGKVLRDISGKSSDPEVLSKFGDLKPHDELFYMNKIHSNLASNENTPSHMLHGIAKADPHFAGSVTKNPNLSSEHADDLVKHFLGGGAGGKTAMHFLVTRPNISEDSKDQILHHATKPETDRHTAGYLLGRLALNPNLSPEHQNRIYDAAHNLTKSHSFVGFDAIQNIAAKPDLHHDLARKINRDFGQDDDIKNILLNNRHLPPRVLE